MFLDEEGRECGGRTGRALHAADKAFQTDSEPARFAWVPWAPVSLTFSFSLLSSYSLRIPVARRSAPWCINTFLADPRLALCEVIEVNIEQEAPAMMEKKKIFERSVDNVSFALLLTVVFSVRYKYKWTYVPIPTCISYQRLARGDYPRRKKMQKERPPRLPPASVWAPGVRPGSR